MMRTKRASEIHSQRPRRRCLGQLAVFSKLKGRVQRYRPQVGSSQGPQSKRGQEAVGCSVAEAGAAEAACLTGVLSRTISRDPVEGCSAEPLVPEVDYSARLELTPQQQGRSQEGYLCLREPGLYLAQIPLSLMLPQLAVDCSANLLEHYSAHQYLSLQHKPLVAVYSAEQRHSQRPHSLQAAVFLGRDLSSLPALWVAVCSAQPRASLLPLNRRLVEDSSAQQLLAASQLQPAS